MQIAVIGTGYVGLVTGTCLAESGNDVIGIDKDESKIATLLGGQLPIYEPGLLELVQRNRRDGRLSFTTDLAHGVSKAQLVFVAVGTPQSADGASDLSSIWAVADALAKVIDGPKVVVIKSTVPVGTNRKFAERLAARCQHPVDVASNPEFLKEGAAVDDFMKPDRVVVGVRRPEAAELLRDLYGPFLRTERPFLVMSPESAEMTKYAANAMLATKISFINEIANFCEHLGADINDVRRGIGHDERIGFQFLFPGVGYGGSCFEGQESVFVCREGRLAVESFQQLIDSCRAAATTRIQTAVACPRNNQQASLETAETAEIVVPDDLQVLGFDLELGKAALANVIALTRRPYAGTMVRIGTSMGRSIRVTADHPVIVTSDTGFDVIPADQVVVGQPLPALCDLPYLESVPDLNLIDLLEATDLEADVHVSPTDNSFVEQYPKFARHVPPSVLKYPHDIRRFNRMPLRLYRLLSDQGLLDVSPDQLQLYTAKGAATKINAVIPVDADLLRLCGYYLAEGFISKDVGRAGAVRERIGFSFHENEREYIEDVQRILQQWGLKYITRNSTSALTTIVSSRIAAWLIRDVLKCGIRSEDKTLPQLAFNVPSAWRHELVRGAFSGDGAVTPVQHDRNFMFEYATVSKSLADGMALLLQSLDVVPSVRVRRMNKSTRDAYIVRVSGIEQLAVLRDAFGDKHRARIDNLLAGYQRTIRQRGFVRHGAFATLHVREVTHETVDTTVYSLETATGTVVASSGLVCHNCFPKDVRAMLAMGREQDAKLRLLQAVDDVNSAQKRVLFDKIKRHFGADLKGKTLALWGLAFKPRTDDIREAPALTIIDLLLAEGAHLRVHDPEAMKNIRQLYGDKLVYCDGPYGTLEGADALAIVTEWQQFRHPNFDMIKNLLRAPVIFDGRNLYDAKQIAELGFTYYSIGR
ncbi:MAG: nucleotide sugar dehydrogenase [Planctomycetia bacterium]|nr:nucleotide sugar dehydrogenase [Planctomycetia bacterium]